MLLLVISIKGYSNKCLIVVELNEMGRFIDFPMICNKNKAMHIILYKVMSNIIKVLMLHKLKNIGAIFCST